MPFLLSIKKNSFLIAVFIFLNFTAFNTAAQLCTGSLGDAVVNVTFGSGAGNNTGYTPTNAYTYTSSSCPNDGFYTITNRTSGCFGNSWITVNADHTGNGAFMLVNASFAPGDFLVTTVTDLCPNTTYEFAAWMMNVMARSGIKPNITFTIESTTGVVLQTFSTGDIPETFSAVWKQYGFFFTTPPANATIVLRMTNNAPGGNGNDIALDDITFRPCSAVKLNAANDANNDTVNICEENNNTYNFSATVSSGFIAPFYNWQISMDSGKLWKDIAGANNLGYTRMPTGAGAYWYRLSASEIPAKDIAACRIASNIIAVNVFAKPIVNAGADRIAISGDTIMLNGNVTGAQTQFYWDPPEGLSNIAIADPVALLQTDKKYILYATTLYGCTNQDEVFIKVVANIFIPNSFTPNNDGKNDRWRIPFLDPLFGASVQVYNRFGQRVYYAKEIYTDWDGTYKNIPQPGGVYVYYINFKNNRKPLKGNITLIR